MAIAATQIQEVIQMAELAPLPDAPAWLAGLLTVGTEHFPVVDLAAHESGRRPRDPSEYVVLAHTPVGVRGLVVDSIEDLVVIDGSKAFLPAPELPFGPHVLAVVNLRSEPVLLLSMAPLSVSGASIDSAT